MTPLPPRTCAWCGRQTTDYIHHDITADHGPAEVVWCRDWRACSTARPPASSMLRNRARTWT